MKSLYGIQIRRDVNELNFCESEHCMETEYDKNVLDYWKLPNRNYIVMIEDDGLDDKKNDRKKLTGTSRSVYVK